MTPEQKQAISRGLKRYWKRIHEILDENESMSVKNAQAQYRAEKLESKEDKRIAEKLAEVLELNTIARIQKATPKVEFLRREKEEYLFKVSIVTKRTRKTFTVRMK